MYLMRSFLAVTLVAGGLVMASPASAAPILTATSFSYDLKSSGTSSTLTAAGDGFDFTINTASLIGPLTINYGSPLFTTILQDSAGNPPVEQITLNGTTYTVLLTRTSASISTVPAGLVLTAGEPSTFTVAAQAQFQYTACVEFGHLPICDPSFASPIADITVALPGSLTVSLTANTQQHNYSILSELFVSTPEPASVALTLLGLLPVVLFVRRSRAR